MALTVPVAHDFICPWCWVALFQVRRLKEEFGVRVDWRGYELFPEGLHWPDYPPAPEKPANKPDTPSRLDFILAADGVEMPHVPRPHKMRTYHAHQAVEYARREGTHEALIERLYEAYWLRGEAINELPVLRKLAEGLVEDLDAMEAAVQARRFAREIVPFDDEAYARGVYNVPTYWIGGERYAEQPYSVLAEAVRRAKAEHAGIDLYADLHFPAAPADRPYTFVNMVATIDGKILSGARDESVSDLGSKVDHRLMRRIEGRADAVLVGAETLRATSPEWDPQAPIRVVVSRSGDIPSETKFLEGGQGYVAAPGSAEFQPPSGAKLLRAGDRTLDFRLLLSRLRALGVERLAVMGGSEINGQLLKADLVDELFLTVAPKVKLGRDVPTYAGGEPLDRHALLRFELLSNEAIGDELFLRYRRAGK